MIDSTINGPFFISRMDSGGAVKAGDGSRELMHAFCLAVISGKQPEKLVDEAYWATRLALRGDQASRERKYLTI